MRILCGMLCLVQDAISNITAVNMVSTVVLPLLSSVTAMLASANRQDPAACAPALPSACNDNWGRPDCCATEFAGAPYPNTTVWQVG